MQDSNPADPNSVKKEWEGRDSPAAHGEAAVPLQLLEIHDGADIHLQAMQETYGGCSEEIATLWSSC